MPEKFEIRIYSLHKIANSGLVNWIVENFDSCQIYNYYDQNYQGIGSPVPYSYEKKKLVKADQLFDADCVVHSMVNKSFSVAGILDSLQADKVIKNQVINIVVLIDPRFWIKDLAKKNLFVKGASTGLWKEYARECLNISKTLNNKICINYNYFCQDPIYRDLIGQQLNFGKHKLKKINGIDYSEIVPEAYDDPLTQFIDFIDNELLDLSRKVLPDMPRKPGNSRRKMRTQAQIAEERRRRLLREQKSEFVQRANGAIRIQKAQLDKDRQEWSKNMDLVRQKMVGEQERLKAKKLDNFKNNMSRSEINRRQRIKATDYQKKKDKQQELIMQKKKRDTIFEQERLRLQKERQNKRKDKENQYRKEVSDIKRKQRLSEKMRRANKMKTHMLIITQTVPKRDRDSGSNSIMSLIDILLNRYKITLLTIDKQSGDNLYIEKLKEKDINYVLQPHIERYLLNFSHQFDYIKLTQFSVIDRCYDAIKKYCPEIPIIYDTIDLSYKRLEKRLEIHPSDELKKQVKDVKKLELDYIRKADHVIVINEQEREEIGKEIGETYKSKVIVVPLIVKEPDMKLAKTAEEREDICFIGNFNHVPNMDAMEFFIKEVFPLLKSRIPEIKLRIIGPEFPKKFRKEHDDESIIYEGFIENLDSIFHQIKFMVSPLRWGAGSKGKIATALSYGIPCICSETTIDGMDLDDCEALVTVPDSDPSAYVDKLCELYHDDNQWKLMSREAQKVFRDRFSERNGQKVVTESVLFRL